MEPDSNWPSAIVLAAIVLFITVVVVLADRRGPDRPPVDLRYFQARSSTIDGGVNLADVSMQVKIVAATRHIPPQEVRRLMWEYAEGGEQEPPSRKRVDIDRLNRVLDERWPLK